MVAKSFQGLAQLSEPYQQGNKMYVDVQLKSGKTKAVRWYTEEEYYKNYPEDKPELSKTNFKKLFGFDKGYITIFAGDQDANEEYLYSCATTRYCTHWGWYVVSYEEVPMLPEGLTAIELPWESVGNDDGSLRPADILRQNVANALGEVHGDTEWVGEIGDSIEILCEVVENTKTEKWAGGKYYEGHCHIFKNQTGNLFMWQTQAQNWPVGSKKLIHAKIKEHVRHNGIKCTQIYYCREV